MFFIHEGYYVLHAVNEAYLPHSSMYGCGVDNNIEVSHGYNGNMDVFYLLNYNKSGNFCSSEVNANDYFNSIARTTVNNRLIFIRAKKGLIFGSTMLEQRIYCDVILTRIIFIWI